MNRVALPTRGRSGREVAGRLLRRALRTELVFPLIAALAALSSACSGASTCAELRLSPEAASAFSQITAQLDFAPQRPCAVRSGFIVESVYADNIAGARRISFAVAWRGEDAFVLSQTRAVVPFSAIPQGTHRMSAEVDGVVASGFAGASGSGSDIAYLRWRAGDVTFELAATLRPWLSESDVRAIAEGLIRGVSRATARSG